MRPGKGAGKMGSDSRDKVKSRLHRFTLTIDSGTTNTRQLGAHELPDADSFNLVAEIRGYAR